MPVLSTLGAATAKAWGFLQQAAGGAADLYFNYVTMLLTGNGTNGAQNNTFLDSSTNAFSITRNGNTTQGSFSPYGPNWSNYFDNSSYFTLPDSSAWAFGTGDFTIEGWWYPTNNSGSDQFLFVQSNNSSPSGSAFQLWLDTSGIVNIAVYTAGGYFILSDSSTIPFNKWNHVAVVRTSSTLSFYVNGVRVATDTIGTDSVNDSAQTVAISARNNGNNKYKGYTSNLRVIKGSGPYNATQSTLTVPTTALTAITNTVLLTCQSNRFIDNSTNAFTLTASGTPSVQRFSPFNPTASYDTATIGGSGYFDGSGDYLQVSTTSTTPFAFGTGDFTLEFWYYPTTILSDVRTFYDARPTASNYIVPSIYMYNGELRYIVDSTDRIFGETLKAGQWYHIALCRSSGSTKLFVNGVQSGSTYSDSNNYVAYNNTPYIFANIYGLTANNPAGYCGDFRIVKGTALYTTTFTPPTSPETAISNTSMLLSFTNAGIPDSAMMNDLETVGNAQVSTSVKKFGTGSIAFDGTGDYLTLPASNLYSFGTGDFTFEGWIKTATKPSGNAIRVWRIGATDVTGTIALKINGSGYLRVDVNAGSEITGTSDVTDNNWHYFAVTRSGTSLKLYVDGTQQGSTATVSQDLNQTLLQIGYDTSASGSEFNGYMDDLRITKGYARTITLPTAAFPTY